MRTQSSQAEFIPSTPNLAWLSSDVIERHIAVQKLFAVNPSAIHSI
jgi:hypothetical protein